MGHAAGQLFLAVILIGGSGLFLLGLIGRLRETSGTTRAAVKTPRGVKAGKPPRGLMGFAAHPAGAIRAQARADAHRIWQQALSADWLRQRDHERALAAKDGGSPAATPTADGKRRVPAHDGTHEGPIRRPVAKALTATGVWPHLPARIQGALCGCAVCKGETAHEAVPPAAQTPSPALPVNGTRPATAKPGSPPKPAVPQQATPPPTTPPTGGTTMSAGAVEKFIDGVHQIHAESAAGDAHAKQRGIKSAAEGSARIGQLGAMLARTLTDLGYGPEITEPLTKAARHHQAAEMAFAEADNALESLLSLTLGDAARSSRRVPDAAEFNGGH